MLKIILREENSPLTFNIDAEFAMHQIPDTTLNRALIKRIDKGEYVSVSRFKDRFGVTLYTSQLSTGCKAALLVANTDLEVDITECGENAIAAIVMLCKSGTIVKDDSTRGIIFNRDEKYNNIDVEVDGYHFTNIVMLNAYLMDMTTPEKFISFNRKFMQELEEHKHKEV